MFCSINLVYGQTKKPSIVGKWTGTDQKNQSGGVEFKSNGSAVLLIKGKELPVDEYKMDYTKDPVLIELIIKINGQNKSLYGLIKFIDPNTIKWEVFPENIKGRPTKFSEQKTNRAIILKRK